MTMSAIKPERKRLDWSVQTSVDQTKIRINPAAETRNHAQFARQMPEPRHSVPKRLDRCAKRQQNATVDVLLGESRFEYLALSHHLKVPGFDALEVLDELFGFI